MNDIACILFPFLLIGFITLCIVSTIMAKKRGRSQLDWFIFSFLFSPVLGIILLTFLGETEERKKKRIGEKEKL